ncbi:MAG TPA: hypothetical protein VG889_14940 [Rhizomicrobium sp.]|nr:hypothetical protein [Rhizomicrobium sp.]
MFPDDHALMLGLLYLAISLAYAKGSHGRISRYVVAACALGVALVYLSQSPFIRSLGYPPPPQLRASIAAEKVAKSPAGALRIDT